MITGRVRQIADKISINFGVPEPIVTRLGNNKIELRTELPSYEGGYELQNELEALDSNWICENYGGCIYIFYRPY